MVVTNIVSDGMTHVTKVAEAPGIAEATNFRSAAKRS